MPLIAYNPTLYLTESHVATYKIYILRNPFTKEVFYVGQTMQDLQTRLSGHITETGANRDKINYIKEFTDKGERPIIEEIETIHARCYIEKESVNEREAYWIKHYRGIGCKLLNVATPSSWEYRSYLSSLKKGETKWHYYYCGKTAGGYEVYDERRLLADGFKFPTETTHTTYEDNSTNFYNPWRNERFIKKIGYKKDYADKYSYEPIYKDTDPNYYDDDY
jgi:hypothetical protein